MVKIIDSIESSSNHAVYSATQVVNKIATNPSAVKKVMQIAIKIFAAADLYQVGQIQDRKVVEAMTGSIHMIEFHGLFRDIMFWVNPFSKDALDEKALLESLKSTMCDSIPSKHKQLRKTNETLATEISRKVNAESEFYSRSEVREFVRQELEDKGYDPSAAEGISQRIVVQQKTRSLKALFTSACFTTIDIVGCSQTLAQWGIGDLSYLAGQIGSQSPVFQYVIDFGAKRIIGTLATSAFIVLFTSATYETVVHGVAYFKSKDANVRSEEFDKLRLSIIGMVSTGADLINSAAPLLFTLNPPVLIGLAIFAKGTGLICILIK